MKASAFHLRSPLRWRGSLATAVLSVFLAPNVGELLTTPACGADRNWTGDSSSLWSDPNNWDPAGVPQNGEDLIFFDAVLIFGPDPMENDLPDLVVNSLTFSVNATYTIDWVLNGNPVTIMGRLHCFGTDERIHINCGLKFGRDVSVTAGASLEGVLSTIELYLNGPINLNGHDVKLNAIEDNALIAVSGGISGEGDVHVYDYRFEFPFLHESTVEFRGTEANTFHGAIILQSFTNFFLGMPQTIPGTHLSLSKQSGAAVTDTLHVENGGVVTLIHNNQFEAGATVILEAGSKLLFNDYDQTASNLIVTNFHADSDSTLVDTGTGTLTLLGGITSWVDNDQGALPTIKGIINLPAGLHNFNVTGFDYAGLDMQAQIVGEGGFNKFGEAALVLEASNIFSGEISVVQGILDVRDNHALGSTAGGVTLSEGGSLTLRNATIAGEGLTARGNRPVTADTSGSLLFTVGTCVWSGSIVLDANLAVFADSTFLTGPVSGAGGLDLRNGTIQLAGPTANTFAGTTLVRCPMLQLNKSSGVNAFVGPLMVGGGASGPYEVRWLNSHQHFGAPVTLFNDAIVNLNNFNEDFGPVTFNGGRVETGTGQFAVHQPITVNPIDVPAFINGYLSLPPPSVMYFNVGDGPADPDLLINAIVIGGAPDLIKQGPGTMRLSGLNTYTGVTVVDQGVLQIDNSNSLGSGGNPAVVHSNATLRLGIAGTITKPLFLSGAGLAGEGAVSVINGGSWTVTGFILLDNPSSIRVGIDAGLSINSAITGTGPLSKLGPGILSLGGDGNNTFSGGMILSAGTLNLAKSTVAVPGSLVVGPAPPTAPAILRSFQSGQLDGSTLTINANSLFDLNGNNQTLSGLNLNDGGAVQTGTGVLAFVGGAAVNAGSQSILGSTAGSFISGRLALPANDFITFNVNPYRVLFSPPTAPELDVPAIISVNGFENPNFAQAGFTKTGSGRMRLGGNNTYKGGTFVNGGTLQVDGVQPLGFVAVNGGTLQGAGTVGHIFTTAASAAVAPGDSPGTLTCSNFNAGGGAAGVLRVELNGFTPGTGYDQLNVRGSVNLGGVSLSASLGFPSAVGNQFVIINNDGADPVLGTFAGLPQNAPLYIGQEQFAITYTGGTGNDVVLTRIPTPPRPLLTIQRISSQSVRLLWPTSAVGFTLQFNTNLNLNSWIPAVPLPTVAGTNNIMTNAANDPQKFYRLSKP